MDWFHDKTMIKIPLACKPQENRFVAPPIIEQLKEEGFFIIDWSVCWHAKKTYKLHIKMGEKDRVFYRLKYGKQYE